VKDGRRRLYYLAGAGVVIALVAFLSCLPGWRRRSRARAELESGIAAYKRDLPEVAEKRLRSALEDDPTLVAAHLYLARIYGGREVRAEWIEKAEREYLSYLVACGETYPRAYAARHELGLVLKRDPRRLPGAAENFRKALKVIERARRTPKYRRNRRALARMKLQNAESLYELGLACRRLRRHQEAEEALVKATALAPENARILTALGRLYKITDRYEKAAEVLAKALEIEDDPAGRFELGIVLRIMGKSQEAEEELLAALRLYRDRTAEDPDDAAAWYHAGLVHLALLEKEKARQDFIEARAAARRAGDTAMVGKAELALRRYFSGGR